MNTTEVLLSPPLSRELFEWLSRSVTGSLEKSAGLSATNHRLYSSEALPRALKLQETGIRKSPNL